MADIKKLVKELEASAEAYYNKGTSPLTDAEFDTKVEELRKIKPDHPFLSRIGAPALGKMVKHTIPVGSQEKLKSREEFDAWADQILALHAKSGDAKEKPFVIQHKLDGQTIVLTFDKGNLKVAASRGDGLTGEVLTENVLKMDGIKGKLSNPLTGVVRGEILLRKDLFEKEFKPKGYKNPRNASAGISRDQKGNDLIKFLSPVVFDIFPEGVDLKTEEQADKLLRYFFPQVVWTKACATKEEVWAEYERIEKERVSLPYELDGVIIRANSRDVQKQLGMSSDMRPHAQKCVKFETMKALTRLISINWTIGHTGALIPTGVVEPVEIGGVTVQNVLLNNPTYMEELDLQVGDGLLLERSGDVIPHVSEVVDRSKRTGSSVPKTCPACGGEVKKDGANVFCQNEECEGKAFRVVKSWVTKRNIKYLGSELLLELYQNHDVKLPQDLYRLTEEYISACPRGVGRVGSASKLIMSEINKSLACPLNEFFGSLCIKFLGRRQCEIMIEAGINTFDKFMSLTVEQLSQVPGFSSDGVKAGTVVAGIKAAKPTVDALLEAGVVVREPAAVSAPVSGLAMSGKVVCFTGVRPKPLEQAQFLELGGVVKDSMSKAVTHLVVKDPNTASNKAEKARSLGITLVAYTEWVKWLGE